MTETVAIEESKATKMYASIWCCPLSFVHYMDVGGLQPLVSLKPQQVEILLVDSVEDV